MVSEVLVLLNLKLLESMVLRLVLFLCLVMILFGLRVGFILVMFVEVVMKLFCSISR